MEMNKSANLKVKIAIMVAQECEDMEVIIPYDLWKRAGISVEKISIEKKNTITLQSGTKIYCEETLEKTNLDRFSAIMIPGGRGHERFLEEKLCSRLHEKLRKFAVDEKKWIFAICAGPSVLSRLEVIKDQKMTVYPGYEKYLLDSYENADVLCDKNIITAKSAAHAFDFSLLVIEKLISKQVALNVAKAILYKK